MKRVLFIPTHHYLSQPLYSKLAEAMKGKFETHLLDTRDPALLVANQSSPQPQYPHIGHVHTVPVIPPPHIYGYKIFLQFHLWAASVRKMVHMLQPDVIISEADNIPTTRILDQSFPHIPLVIVQAALLNNDPKKYLPVKRSLLKRVLRPILAPLLDPIRTPPQFFGLNHPRHHIFIFGERTKTLYRDRLPQHLHLVGNPLIESSTHESGGSITCLLPVDANAEEERHNLEDFLYLAQNFPDENFIFKPHPRSQWQILAQQIEQKGFLNISWEHGQDFGALARRTKLCVSSFSFADFHFIAAHIPLIHHRRDDLAFFNSWFNDASIPRSKKAQDLVDLVKSQLNHPHLTGQDKFLGEIFSHLGAQSLQATISAIEDVLA